MSSLPDWAKSLNCAVTVCNRDGQIIYMNEKSQRTFGKSGGEELVGKSMFPCHNQRSVDIIHRLMTNNESNAYTIEKNGIKKLIYQTPWHTDGVVEGLVELSIELPLDLPHFIR